MSIRDRLLLLLAGLAAIALGAGYTLSGVTVSLTVDGVQTSIRTHQATVGDMLSAVGYSPAETDRISPPLSSPVLPGGAVVITRAHPFVLHVDGRTIELQSFARTVTDLLGEAGVRLQTRDQVLLDGLVVGGQSPLREQAASTGAAVSLASFAPLSPASSQAFSLVRTLSPVAISVRRAVSVTISQDGVETSAMSAAPVIGEVLFGEGIYIYAADRVAPALDSAVTAGMRITIQRAKPVTVFADGRNFTTRTQATTIAKLLDEEGMPAEGKDFSQPGLQTAITPGLVVRVTRVREATITESEGIPFKTAFQPDSNLELDQQRIVAHGKRGVFKRTIRVVYENGNEVSRVVDREWTDEEPSTQIVAYGTKVVIRTLQTPEGPVDYWRELRTWATFYTPLTSGTALDAPYFGITFTGRRATKGIIAVDPRAIRLHTPMYVPGYGFGAAEDTGNLIKGMVIDLCYDDDNSHPERWTWARWTTAYLLTPVPGDIPYILPDFPREPN